MRSSRDRRGWLGATAVTAWLGLAIGLGGCGETFEPGVEDGPDPCATSVLTYDNFGEPFVLDWCRGCHSAALTTDELRQEAPVGVDFDTVEDVQAHAPRILVRATATAVTPTMPPAAGPSPEERALLAEWLACGAP